MPRGIRPGSRVSVTPACWGRPGKTSPWHHGQVSAVFTVCFPRNHVKMRRMVLSRGFIFPRWKELRLLTCILLLQIVSLRLASAKGDTDLPFSAPAKRYLFIVENSREMQPHARAVFETLKSLLDSTAKTQLRPGD